MSVIVTLFCTHSNYMWVKMRSDEKRCSVAMMTTTMPPGEHLANLINERNVFCESGSLLGIPTSISNLPALCKVRVKYCWVCGSDGSFVTVGVAGNVVG